MVFGERPERLLISPLIRNEGVGCSSHPSGTINFNDLRRE